LIKAVGFYTIIATRCAANGLIPNIALALAEGDTVGFAYISLLKFFHPVQDVDVLLRVESGVRFSIKEIQPGPARANNGRSHFRKWGQIPTAG
jgi:hypothetical protein